MERLKRPGKLAKLEALKDIQKECGKGKTFIKNYIYCEKQILNSPKDVRN